MKKAILNQIDRNQNQKRLIPIDKKLMLAQSIREENLDNRMKIRQRERLLYGTDAPLPLWRHGDSMRAEESLYAGADAGYGMQTEEASSYASGTFKLRMAAAIALFIGFLLCDAGQYKVFGYSMNDICGMISEDYFQIYDSENPQERIQLSELLKFESK